MKVGRNDPCPCGSGTKVKRCCGVGAVRRSDAALEDLLGLAFHFPRQRAASATFAAWAERADDKLTRELVEDGLGHLGSEEVARIPAEFAAAYPQVWETIVIEAGRREDALETVLVGAVVAGLEERQRQLDAEALELLELDEEAREDPVESLAAMLVPGDLWNVLEVVEAVDSLDSGVPITAIAERLWTEWHEHRLGELVGRLQARLPVRGFPAVTAAIEGACRAFQNDHRMVTRLRAELLRDALPTAADALLRAA